MLECLVKGSFVLLCGVLYRWGGGPIGFLPRPFGVGWKAARRYVLPICLALITGAWVPMAVFSIITHFNLKEIGERRWDDVACYGFAQAWCFAGSGYASGLIGAWWFIGTWLSNIGIQTTAFCPRRLGAPMNWYKCKIDWRLPWHWVEFGQGVCIGISCLF